MNSLREFLSDFHNKRLERFFISEEVPDNKGKTINTIVGSTFKKEVIDSSDNYLIFMCPDLDEEIDCVKGLETFTATVETLHHFSNVKEANLKFGIIDVAKNEVDSNLFCYKNSKLIIRSIKKTKKISLRLSSTELIENWNLPPSQVFYLRKKLPAGSR